MTECECPPGLHPYSTGCLTPDHVGRNVTPRSGTHVGVHDLIYHATLEDGDATYWATCGCGDWRSRPYKKSETAAKRWREHAAELMDEKRTIRP